MKTIGLIGGMSWKSSLEYYRTINEYVREKLGGGHSAQCLMYSVDFEEIEKLQHRGDWGRLTGLMVEAAVRLKQGGADCLVICSNTMHKMADDMEKAIGMPLLHIGDAAAGAMKKQGIARAALLGTRFTMEEDFYRKRLAEKHGITVMIPASGDREFIHRIIYDELCRGKIIPKSRARLTEIISGLAETGAQGIVLGCTEIPLLVKQNDVSVPLFDTTELHARAAVDYALN